jgi:hypothetical protein
MRAHKQSRVTHTCVQLQKPDNEDIRLVFTVYSQPDHLE